MLQLYELLKSLVSKRHIDSFIEYNFAEYYPLSLSNMLPYFATVVNLAIYDAHNIFSKKKNIDKCNSAERHIITQYCISAPELHL